jgi:hypothetical protein
LLLRTGEIQFGRVLDQQRNLLGRDSLDRSRNVRLQNSLRRDHLVLEETIGSHHFVSPATRRWNACCGTFSQGGKNLPKPLVQSFVLQIGTPHFFPSSAGPSPVAERAARRWAP